MLCVSRHHCAGLAEQLVVEVRRLHQELGVYQAKLNTATEIIEKMPSEGEGEVVRRSGEACDNTGQV